MISDYYRKVLGFYKKYAERKLLYVILGVLWGIIIFGIVYDFSVINPTNVDWIWQSGDGDRILAQEEWQFYRNSRLVWPIGQYEGYPYPLRNSVVISDIAPIFCIPLKLISFFLPQSFQYWGLYLCFSCIMQGVMASLILKCLNVDFLKSIFAIPLFLVNCTLLGESYNHWALMGQFVILWALYLIYNEELRNATYRIKLKNWAGCLALSLAVQPYLFIMNGFIFTYDVICDFFLKKRYKESIIRFFCCVLIILFEMYFIGGFGISNPSVADTLGDNAFDMVYLLHPLAWYGKGVFFIIIGALYFIKIERIDGKEGYNKLIFFLVLILMMFIAISPVWHYNGEIIINFKDKLPEIVLFAWGTIRSTIRMIWPLSYLIIIKCIKIINENGCSRNVTAMLCIAAITQCVTILPQKNFDLKVTEPYTNEVMNFFEEHSDISETIEHVTYLSWGFGPHGYENVGIYCCINNKTLSTGYFPRYDLFQKAESFKDKYYEELISGNFQESTLYCIFAEVYDGNDWIHVVERCEGIEIYRTENYYYFYKREHI